jgi:hypothetical protein
MILLKLGAEVLGAAASAILGIIAVGESTPLTYSAIVAVLGFAGLLVRQITANQKMYVEIVASKDIELAQRDDALHYLRWEMESMRYRYGERTVDPGPYAPRRPPGAPAT